MKRSLLVIAGIVIAGIAYAGTLAIQDNEVYTSGYDAINQSVTWSVTVTGTPSYSETVSVTNGGNKTISFPNVTTPGRVFGRNVSSTNETGFVRLSIDGGATWMVGAKPGEPFSFRVATNVTEMTASVSSTSNHVLRITVLSD